MKDNKLYIEYILDSVRKIESYTLGFDNDSFLKDSKTQSSVIMQLILIGEVSNKLSEDTKSKIDLPWHKIIGLRHMAVHEYMNLDLYIIWDTVQNKIPEMKEKLLEYKQN